MQVCITALYFIVLVLLYFAFGQIFTFIVPNILPPALSLWHLIFLFFSSLFLSILSISLWCVHSILMSVYTVCTVIAPFLRESGSTETNIDLVIEYKCNFWLSTQKNLIKIELFKHLGTVHCSGNWAPLTGWHLSKIVDWALVLTVILSRLTLIHSSLLSSCLACGEIASCLA